MTCNAGKSLIAKEFHEEFFENLVERFFDAPGTREILPGSRTLAQILKAKTAFSLLKTLTKQAKMRKTGPLLEAKSFKNVGKTSKNRFLVGSSANSWKNSQKFA